MVSDEETNGGAAISASNLAEGLIKDGVTVLRLVLFPNFRNNDPWHTIPFWQRNNFTEKAFAKSIPIFPKSLKFFFANKRFKQVLASEKPDVINFHNILWGIDNGYNLDMYTQAAEYAPVFITMHDMWNIIGYPYDLSGILDKNIMDNWKVPEMHLKGQTEKQLNHLRERVFKNENIFFISPSNWLKNELIKKFSFTGNRVVVIPYGVDTEIFKPADKPEARRSLNIPDNKINILASAASLGHINKGFHILMHVLNQRDNSDIRLLLMGDDHIIQQMTLPENIEWLSFGYIDDKMAKANIYNVSDILAFPSFADNLPNSILESLACGTPVIAFNTCGLPDLVRENKTGWLSENVDSSCYALTFERAIQDFKKGTRLAASSRQFAVTNFAMNKQSAAYISIFNNRIRKVS